MKKAITILAIIAIVAGTVFAAETHTIKIKADVTEVLPAFQLVLEAPADTETTNDSKVVFTENANYAENTAKDVNFNLDKGGTVNLSAKLANEAKTLKAFDIAFSMGDFDVTINNGTPHTLSPTITTTAPDVDIQGISSVVKVSQDADADVRVTFNGSKVLVGDVGTALATAKYVYAALPEVDLKDPNDNGGFYEATVKMMVSIH